MDMFMQKCNTIEAKISLHKEKQNYKQTHIPVDIFLQKDETH